MAFSRAAGRTVRQLLVTWLVMRVFSGIWIALVAQFDPVTEREYRIALWPPATPLLAWLERVILAPWERWDVKYYLLITGRGYRADDGTAQFHPLLAWLAIPLTYLGMSPLLALMLVSSAASALLLIAFERLALLDLAPDAARTSTLFLLFAPPAFILFAPYTEALFLLCAVLCLFWARQQAWWLACLAGGLAVLTRQQGLFLALPVAWELWTAADRNWRRALAQWQQWFALGLFPAALLLWLVYRALALGDLNPDWNNPQALIYSLLISPSAEKVVPVQAFLWPWQALWLALDKLWREPEISLMVDLTLGGGFLILLAFAWRSLRTSYRIYVVAIALVSFGYYTGPHYPYMGLPRHLLLAFPLFIGLGDRIRGRGWRAALLGGGLLGFLFLLFLYTIESWTP